MTNSQPMMNRIKELRNSRGLSQKKLADILGISDTALQNYEYQKRKLPGDVLMKLADYFCVSADYIMMITDDPQRYPATSVQEPAAQDEQELVSLYRIMQPEQKALLMNNARAFAALSDQQE